MADETKRVVVISVVSRLLVLTLTLLFRSFLHPYDTSASIDPPCLLSPFPSPSLPPRLPRLASALAHSAVWDSVYFVRVARCGYEYEQTFAFFPALPALISALARSVFAPLVPIVGYRAVLVLAGYVVSNVAFVFAAVYLYKLSLLILKDPALAFRASVLFCFNPASIFYSSIYSESLYALFSLGGLYHIFTGYNTLAMLLFALSGSVRSNGVLNAGYFCFQAINQAYVSIFLKNKPILAAQAVIVTIVRSVVIFAPFVAFQVYGYFNICSGVNTNDLRPWCKARVPRLYDFLQSHYWGVGFLRYFQVKQLPNFLLASPMLSLAVCSIFKYAKMRPDVMFSLGFHASADEKLQASMLYSSKERCTLDAQTVDSNTSSWSQKGNVKVRRSRQETKANSADAVRKFQLEKEEHISLAELKYSSILLLPFIYHLAFLTVTAFFVMHVQVASRFLSASPPIYWFAAYIMGFASRRFGYLIWVYFLAYVLLGSLLFSNFYPFT